MQNNNITFDVKVISFIVLFISILFAIDANAQKDSHFKSTYNEQITITYDGNERIVTIITSMFYSINPIIDLYLQKMPLSRT